MADRIPVGNRLYLYRLIAQHFGIGRQAFLPKVEEVLADDGIAPQDLGFETVRDLMAACDDFVTLTDFKGGRTYVTLVRNAAWDEALAAPDTDAKPAKGGKPWKKRKGSQLKPVKPRHRKQKAAPKDEEPAPTAETPSEEPTPAPEQKPATEAVEPAPSAKDETPAGVTADAADQDDRGDAGEEAPMSASTSESEPDHPHAYTLAEILAMPSEPVPQPDAQPGAPAAAAAPEAEPTPQEPMRQPATRQEAERDRQEAEQQAVSDTTQAITDAPARKEGAASPTGTQTRRAATPPATPTRKNEPAAPLAQTRTIPSSLPHSFLREVHCKDELLSMLTQMLPFDASLSDVLEQDWLVALATGTVEGSRSRATFPIRYVRDDGSPITLTIRRSSRPVAGKQWSLALVNGDDGSGAVHEVASMEGLPEADEGAWSDLVPASRRDPADTSPLRELAQYATIGTWDAALGTLARMARPERWSDPALETPTTRYPVLREYLCLTFHRARLHDGLATTADGSFAAFDTGLLTPFLQDIYACFEATPQAATPYRLAGFAVPGSDELGQRLVASFDPLPEPVSYLESLDDVMPRPGKLVTPDYRAILTREPGRLPRGFLATQLDGSPAAAALDAAYEGDATFTERRGALRELGRAIESDANAYRHLCRALDDAVAASLARARRDFRWCAPVYEPLSDGMRLLLPLALVDDTQVDCALVLELMPSGGYQASGIVSLPRARACARVVATEMPSWLEA